VIDSMCVPRRSESDVLYLLTGHQMLQRSIACDWTVVITPRYIGSPKNTFREPKIGIGRWKELLSVLSE
jgi:hypothetical protein